MQNKVQPTLWAAQRRDLDYFMEEKDYLLFGENVKNKEDGILGKIIIPHNVKKHIIKQLNLLGVNEKSIYPGLDGIGKYIDQHIHTAWWHTIRGSMFNANLRMLVNGVTVYQNDDKSMDVHFEINGDFTSSTIMHLLSLFADFVVLTAVGDFLLQMLSAKQTKKINQLHTILRLHQR